MLSPEVFIRSSLELHLFFLRIMKEHALFLEGGFTPKNQDLAQRADALKEQLANLLAQAVALADGRVSRDFLQSGEAITPFTLRAEEATVFFTGIPINTDITRAEASLMGNGVNNNLTQVETQVRTLNDMAIRLVNELINFKTMLLNEMLTCKLYTFNYPLLIDHIRREARLFVDMLTRLQSGAEIETIRDALEQEIFWNRIMSEHAEFIRGLLDPTEEALFAAANNFANEFEQLMQQARAATGNPAQIDRVTDESLAATTEIRNFKRQATEGILNCNIRSIILPLLADHTVREANHFLRLLRKFDQMIPGSNGNSGNAGNGSNGNSYVVRQGDTLFLIAQRFNTTVQRIMAANPQITDSNVISPGQRIRIP